MVSVSYPMIRITHPYRNFYVVYLFCVFMLVVWLRVQGFESTANKDFQKVNGMLIHRKTIKDYAVF